MKTTASYVKVLVLAVLLLPLAGYAAKAKSYQVTGKVVELSDTTIIVQKDDEKWEITRDANSKVTGDLKVGAKVTIQYKMTATSVDVKEDKKEKKDK